MLAEARGFRVSMTLAHQHLGQLTRELKEGISTNARSKVFFNASPEDARELSRHTAPRLSEHDLAHLGVYHVAARLVVHGEETEPFTMTTTPMPDAIPGRAKEIRAVIRRSRRNSAASSRPVSPTVPSRPAAPTPRRPQTRVRKTDPRRTQP
jgi:hypothetical protein